jgi:hypothetical protein
LALQNSGGQRKSWTRPLLPLQAAETPAVRAIRWSTNENFRGTSSGRANSPF